ncbi:MAG: cell division protein ZapA [Gemmatimonadota bacterium]
MAENERQIQGVIVQIFGEDYRIGGEAAQVRQVADYVDRRMRELAEEHGGRLPKAQVAILAAMEITAELFKVMQERKAFTTKAHESIDRLTKLVEERARLSEKGEAPTAPALPLERRLRDQPVRLRDPSAVVP